MRLRSCTFILIVKLIKWQFTECKGCLVLFYYFKLFFILARDLPLCPISSVHHVENGFLSYPLNLFDVEYSIDDKIIYNCTAVDSFPIPNEFSGLYHRCFDSGAQFCPLRVENIFLSRKFSATYSLRSQTCSFANSLHFRKPNNRAVNFYFFGGSVTQGSENSFGCCCVFDSKCPYREGNDAFTCKDGRNYKYGNGR